MPFLLLLSSSPNHSQPHVLMLIISYLGVGWDGGILTSFASRSQWKVSYFNRHPCNVRRQFMYVVGFLPSSQYVYFELSSSGSRCCWLLLLTYFSVLTLIELWPTRYTKFHSWVCPRLWSCFSIILDSGLSFSFHQSINSVKEDYVASTEKKILLEALTRLGHSISSLVDMVLSIQVILLSALATTRAKLQSIKNAWPLILQVPPDKMFAPSD